MNRINQAANRVMCSMAQSGDHRTERLVYLAKHYALVYGVSSEKVAEKSLYLIRKHFEEGWLE